MEDQVYKEELKKVLLRIQDSLEAMEKKLLEVEQI